MQRIALSVFAVAVLQLYDAGTVQAQEWMLGTPTAWSGFTTTSTIGVTGTAPAGGGPFTAEVRSMGGTIEQSFSGTTTGMPGMPMAGGFFQGNLVPPPGGWIPDVMLPWPFPPNGNWATFHQVRVKDVAGDVVTATPIRIW